MMPTFLFRSIFEVSNSKTCVLTAFSSMFKNFISVCSEVIVGEVLAFLFLVPSRVDTKEGASMLRFDVEVDGAEVGAEEDISGAANVTNEATGALIGTEEGDTEEVPTDVRGDASKTGLAAVKVKVGLEEELQEDGRTSAL